MLRDTVQCEQGAELVVSGVFKVEAIRDEVHLVVTALGVPHSSDTPHGGLFLRHFASLHNMLDGVCVSVHVRTVLCRLYVVERHA